MCEYVNLEEAKCNITKEVCPYLYFCNKIKKYKPSVSMSQECKVKEKKETPKGFYKVCFEKKKFLYINVNDQIQIIENPYDFIPSYVKMSKLKNGAWKIKEAK